MAGFQFAKNVPLERQKDSMPTIRVSGFGLEDRKKSPKWKIREKTGQKGQLVKRVQQENKKKQERPGM